MVSIYILVDPRNGRVRYVGQSANPTMRAAAHRSARSGHPASARCMWIAELLQCDLAPRLIVIGDVARTEADEAERAAIAFFLSVGASLTNVKEADCVRVGVRCSTLRDDGEPCRRHATLRGRRQPQSEGPRCSVHEGRA